MVTLESSDEQELRDFIEKTGLKTAIGPVHEYKDVVRTYEHEIVEITEYTAYYDSGWMLTNQAKNALLAGTDT